MLHLILTLLNFIFPGICFRFHIGINLKVYTGFSVNELSFISLIYTIYIGESSEYFIVVRKLFEFFLYFEKLVQLQLILNRKADRFLSDFQYIAKFLCAGYHHQR